MIVTSDIKKRWIRPIEIDANGEFTEESERYVKSELAEEAAEAFLETDNPYMAIASFLTAYEAGAKLPDPIRAWFADAIYSYIDNRQSFDKSLGFSADRGKTSKAAESIKLGNANKAMAEMWRLQQLLSINAHQAAYMVSERMAYDVEHYGGKPSNAYSDTTLIKYWYSERNKWRGFPRSDDDREVIETLWENDTPEHCLLRYPEHSRPVN